MIFKNWTWAIARKINKNVGGRIIKTETGYSIDYGKDTSLITIHRFGKSISIDCADVRGDYPFWQGRRYRGERIELVRSWIA